ncbi:MAG: FtsK/SpoIIIE domain-containing protein, partial [Acutalibacteraceae bacterium]
MYNQNAIRFSAHCTDIQHAVRALQVDGFASEELDQAAKNLLKMAREITNVGANILPKNANAFSIGTCKTGQMEIGLDINKGFSLLLTAETEADRLSAKEAVFSLMTKIAADSNNCWRCISARDGALSFGQLNSIIISDANRFGGKVYSDEIETNALLGEIENLLNQNVLNSGSENVFEYIQDSKDPLQIITVAVFDLSSFSEIMIRKLRNICNHMKAGLNIIVVDHNPSVSKMLPFELQAVFESGQFSFKYNDTVIPAIQAQHMIDPAELNSLQQKREISSLFEDVLGNNLTPFTKQATDCIEIPFAVLENGNVCSFKIGGKSSPHALISGRTGSGKSVTLHTVIDLITLYYRPDDVEIWTIDYKAVEFKCYVDERTPHISVIGQDNSVDFSISLMKLLVEEYNRRKKLFTDASVKDLEEYRKKIGNRSVTRLLIVIDEFHNLVQAIQNYPSNEYKVSLDNLLKEARSMGMSFIFCSQSVASGLTGLPESGKNQIGVRICMKQDTASEIAETL